MSSDEWTTCRASRRPATAHPVSLRVSAEFEEAAELLSADPQATTLSMSAPDGPAAAPAGEDVKLDLSEDEEGQEESSEVREGLAVGR